LGAKLINFSFKPSKVSQIWKNMFLNSHILLKKIFLFGFEAIKQIKVSCNIIILLRKQYFYMKVIKSIPHPTCDITLFWWNQKYILKFEKNHLEQTYKISELDFLEQDVEALIGNEGFIEGVLKRFEQMYQDLYKSLEE